MFGNTSGFEPGDIRDPGEAHTSTCSCLPDSPEGRLAKRLAHSVKETVSIWTSLRGRKTLVLWDVKCKVESTSDYKKVPGESRGRQ